MDKVVESEWSEVTDDVDESVRKQWWARINAKYNETGREAHNIKYLTKKLKEVAHVRDCLSNAKAFILALFFQYLNYDPKDSDLYTKNLGSFEEFSAEAGLSQDDNAHKLVQELLLNASISSTEENKIEGAYGEGDIHFFVDLDMLALGSPPEEYSLYIKDLALEYSFLDPTSYKNLRRRVLQSFLLIPNIFATKIFREKYEEQARNNIQSELNDLT